MSHMNVRERIESYHGSLLAKQARQQPPTDREEVVYQAFLTGKLAGVTGTLDAFDDGLSGDVPPQVAQAYIQLSRAYQTVAEECRDDGGIENGGGFQ